MRARLGSRGELPPHPKYKQKLSLNAADFGCVQNLTSMWSRGAREKDYLSVAAELQGMAAVDSARCGRRDMKRGRGGGRWSEAVSWFGESKIFGFIVDG